MHPNEVAIDRSLVQRLLAEQFPDPELAAARALRLTTTYVEERVSADDVMVSTDPQVETQARQLDRGPAKRMGSVLVGVVVLALKADAYVSLLSDGRVLVLIILGFAAVIGLLHGRPLRMAVTGGAFVGVAVDLPSVWLRVGTGVAAVVGLVAISVAIGALLQWLDRRNERSPVRAFES